MNRFLRLLKVVAQHLRRNMWLTIITIVIMTFASISGNVVIMTQRLLQSAHTSLGKKIDAVVYLKLNATNDDARTLQKALQGLPVVADVVVESADDVFKAFSKRYEGDAETMKALNAVGNPFGPVVRVTADTLEDYPKLLTLLQDPTIVPDALVERKSFDDHRDALFQLTRMESAARRTVQGMVLFFTLLSLFVVYNTIRMAIYSQRDEIGIMKLVGATNWFIRFPFLIEAVVYTVISVGLSTAVLVPFLHTVDPTVVTLFGSSQASLILFYQQYWPFILTAQVIGLGILSIGSAVVAVGKHLKV